MEIKKEEIEDYIENNLYFLCNQDRFKNDEKYTELIKNINLKKEELINNKKIIVEYEHDNGKNTLLRVNFGREIVENLKNATYDSDGIYEIYNKCDTENKYVKNPSMSDTINGGNRSMIFKYLKEKVNEEKTQTLIDKIKEKIENEVEEYIKNKKIRIKKINKYKQKIYYGVPGCGKSYTIKKELDEVIESEENRSSRIFRVTVHPDYSYGDFIGSIMPKVREKTISYEFVPGIFTRALKRALELRDKNENVYLIVEEMTRGNIAEIFGDIFQLLDRDENGESEYEIDNENIYRSIYEYGSSNSDNSEENETKKPENERWLSNNKIKLPSNFYIWGTLNTSDQNVFVMDNAFKRRFNFQLIKADGNKAEMDEKLNNEFKEKFFKSFDGNQKFWQLDNDFVKELNNYIIKELELNEDKQIGNYFIKILGEDQEFANVVANKLLYYLWYDVQKVTYGDKYIFNKDKITKFEDIFDKDNLNNIFSENFYKKVINKESENEGNENESRQDI